MPILRRIANGSYVQVDHRMHCPCNLLGFHRQGSFQLAEVFVGVAVRLSDRKLVRYCLVQGLRYRQSKEKEETRMKGHVHQAHTAPNAEAANGHGSKDTYGSAAGFTNCRESAS